MFHLKTLYILTEGGIIINSDYFDGINDLDDFNLLKFIVTSELRLKLLFSLYDSSKTIKELESEFNRKPGNISRGLNELKSCKLIQKFPNKMYAVSSIGFLLAKNLENLMYNLEAVDANGEFWENHSIRSIPNKFLKELSLLLNLLNLLMYTWIILKIPHIFVSSCLSSLRFLWMLLLKH